jgi:phosphatidylserine/phosphatidylglycerophosphate/cardiolipin synthase-like enzyme
LTASCLRTGAANFSASGLERQDNDLIVIESAEAAASFKRNFDARFASGEVLSARAR